MSIELRGGSPIAPAESGGVICDGCDRTIWKAGETAIYVLPEESDEEVVLCRDCIRECARMLRLM